MLIEKVTLALVGFGMMIIGLALGVSIVLLPIGLVIGLTGLAAFVAGFAIRLK